MVFYLYRANGQLNRDVKVVREPKSQEGDMVIPCEVKNIYENYLYYKEQYFSFKCND